MKFTTAVSNMERGRVGGGKGVVSGKEGNQASLSYCFAHKHACDVQESPGCPVLLYSLSAGQALLHSAVLEDRHPHRAHTRAKCNAESAQGRSIIEAVTRAVPALPVTGACVATFQVSRGLINTAEAMVESAKYWCSRSPSLNGNLKLKLESAAAVEPCVPLHCPWPLTLYTFLSMSRACFMYGSASSSLP